MNIFKKILEEDKFLFTDAYEVKKKTLVLKILSLIGVLTFLIFALLNLSQEILPLFWLNSISSIILFIIFIFLQLKRDYRIIAFCGSTYIIIHILILYFVNVNHIIGMIWGLVLPILIFLLNGRKIGIYLVSVFFSIMIVETLILVESDSLTMPTLYVVEYYFAFIIISIVSFYIELIRYKSVKYWKKAHNELTNKNNELNSLYSALINSERKFKSIMDTANDGIMMLNDFKVSYVNNKTLNLLKLNNNEIKGKLFLDFIAEEEQEKVKKIYLNRLKTKNKTEPYETIVRNPYNDFRLNVEVNASLLEINNEILTIAIIRDITQRKIEEEQREALIDELERSRDLIMQDALRLKELNNKLLDSESNLKDAIEVKDKFISVLSHDLINPISGSRNLIELLYSDYKNMNEDEIAEILITLKQSSTNTESLFRSLLDWIRSQSDSIEVNPELINLKMTIDTTLDILYTQAKNKKIVIENSIDSDVEVFCDRNLLDTVIRNLVSNAIKFTFIGGFINLSCEKINGFIEVSVKDSGVGMSEEKLNDLFRIDKKVTTFGTTNEKGNGFGLLLVKEFVEKNGGDIVVESEVNKGSIFKFTIPVANV